MNRVKQWWGWIVTGVVGAISLFLYLYSKKNELVEALTMQLTLAKTQKEVDLIEAQVNKLKATEARTAQEIKDLELLEIAIESKRYDINKAVENLKDPREIAEYWEKQ